MLKVYRKYYVAYICISTAIILCMIVAYFILHISLMHYIFVAIIDSILISITANALTLVANKKLSKEVIVLFNECHINEYINTLKPMFENRKGVLLQSIYHTLISKAYACLDDYDSVYEHCQYIKAKNYQSEYHRIMIEYYLKKENFDLVQLEINELVKLMEKMNNEKYKDSLGISIKNANYYMRMNTGNFEGAEEHYVEVLNLHPTMPLIY